MRSRDGGFSLVELLAALAVFGVGMAALWKGLATSHTLVRRAADLSVASRLVDQAMEDLRAGRLALQDGVAPRPELREAQLAIVVEAVAGAAALDRVGLRLTWVGDGDRRVSVENAFFLHRPEQ